MPLIPVKPDPTWAEIKAALESAIAEAKAQAQTARTAAAAAKASTEQAQAARRAQQEAEKNYGEWEIAIRRKLQRG